MDEYYKTVASVDQYVTMAEGFDGRELIAILRQFVPDGATVLELGMGPGKDLDLLGQHYQATGSDFSEAFLARYRQAHPDADLLLLDARQPQTERRFDAVYSNKVLYHLTPDELRTALVQQAALLRPGGIGLHTFWFGEGVESQHGLIFSYYDEESLRAMIGPQYEVLALTRYAEMEPDDSLCLILRKVAG